MFEIFSEFWNIRDEDYLSLNPSHIVFTYKLLDNNQIIKSSKINRSIILKEKQNSFNFKGYNLPATMDFMNWGTLLFKSDSFAQIKKIILIQFIIFKYLIKNLKLIFKSKIKYY